MTRKIGTLHENKFTFMTISLSVLRRTGNVSGKLEENTKNTHVIFIFYPQKILPFVRECAKILQGRTGHRWQYGAYALHVGYKHALRICNTYCFRTATMVERSRLNIALYVHCLSCSDGNYCVHFAYYHCTYALQILPVSSLFHQPNNIRILFYLTNIICHFLSARLPN